MLRFSYTLREIPPWRIHSHTKQYQWAHNGKRSHFRTFPLQMRNILYQTTNQICCFCTVCSFWNIFILTVTISGPPLIILLQWIEKKLFIRNFYLSSFIRIYTNLNHLKYVTTRDINFTDYLTQKIIILIVTQTLARITPGTTSANNSIIEYLCWV